MTAGFEFHELVPRARGVYYVVRRDDFVAACEGSKPAAELLHLLLTALGTELGRIDDDDERGLEEELLTGEEPERAGIHVRFTQRELAKRLGMNRETVGRAAGKLEELGLVSIGRIDGETADRAFIYVVNVRGVRARCADYADSLKRPRRPRIRLVNAEAGNPTTGGRKSDNRLTKTRPPTVHNPADEGREADRGRSKSRPPVDRWDYSDSLSTTKGDDPLPSLPISTTKVKEELLRKAGLPKALREIDLEAIGQPDESYAAAATAATRWSSGELRGLVLLGGPGRGKTTLAAAATWRALGRKESLAWVLASELPRILGADFNDVALRELTETLNRNCGLILDDLEQMEGKRAARQVAAAVTARVQAGRSLLVTSSLSVAELESELGERLVSRLIGYCEIAELRGPNLHKLIARRRAA